jgi:hypothetical protein
VGEYVAAFFYKALQVLLEGLFFVIGVACSQACLEESGQACSVRRLSFEKPVLLNRLFCFYAVCDYGLLRQFASLECKSPWSGVFMSFESF